MALKKKKSVKEKNGKSSSNKNYFTFTSNKLNLTTETTSIYKEITEIKIIQSTRFKREFVYAIDSSYLYVLI